MITTIYPYLIMNGNGQEAVKFYEYALSATVVHIRTFGEMSNSSDSPIAENLKHLVLNAHLQVGNTNLMISDTNPGPQSENYQIGSHVEIALMVTSIEKAKEVYQKLSDGGKEILPLQEMFWSPCYGQVQDRFGVNWQITVEVEN